MFYFYLFRCQDGSLYSGSTKNLKKREQAHNSGRGSKYVLSRGGGKMAYSEKFRSAKKARQREAEVKTWRKQEKEQLIGQLK